MELHFLDHCSTGALTGSRGVAPSLRARPGDERGGGSRQASKHGAAARMSADSARRWQTSRRGTTASEDEARPSKPARPAASEDEARSSKHAWPAASKDKDDAQACELAWAGGEARDETEQGQRAPLHHVAAVEQKEHALPVALQQHAEQRGLVHRVTAVPWRPPMDHGVVVQALGAWCSSTTWLQSRWPLWVQPSKGQSARVGSRRRGCRAASLCTGQPRGSE